MYDPTAEKASRDERARLQQDRLRGLVDRLLAVGGVQGERLAGAGVGSGAELSLDDLPRLPLTSKQDLWDAYPWGMLAVPADHLAAVHGSSGTGGRVTLVGYTRADLRLWAQMCARSLACAGGSSESIVHNAYGYGLFTGGTGIHQGAIELGATVLPMSAGMTARQLRVLVDLRADVLTCTPSYAIHLGEGLREAGVGPDELGLRAGVFGAEPWSEGMRAEIEALLPLKAVDIYGLSEIIGPGVATECVQAQRGLHVNEDHFLVEAVDPESGVPVLDGTAGELVFTTPTKEALPLLRYRTGDVAVLSRGDCACGRTLIRMSKVLGRADDMLVIRGVNVFPSEVERVLLADGRFAPHYQLVVDRRGEGLPRLVVACERAGSVHTVTGSGAGSSPDEVGRMLEHALAETLGLHADVRVLPGGSVPRVEAGKAVRTVTWSDGEAPLPGLE